MAVMVSAPSACVVPPSLAFRLCGFKFDVLVELGDGYLHADFWQCENVVLGQGVDSPRRFTIASVEDLQTGGYGFHNDVAKDGGHGFVFANLRDTVDGARGRAQDFEDDDDVGRDFVGARKLRAGDEGVRIADCRTDGSDAEIGPVVGTGFPAQSGAQGGGNIDGDTIVVLVAPGHGDRSDTVELVAVLLVFGPGEEALGGPWLLQGDVHGLEPSTGRHGVLSLIPVSRVFRRFIVCSSSRAFRRYGGASVGEGSRHRDGRL